jgi:hypothetical protein
MRLLQSGVPFSVIALWLGHESTTTTHRYVEADLAMKDQALARLQARAFAPWERKGPKNNQSVSEIQVASSKLPIEEHPGYGGFPSCAVTKRRTVSCNRQSRSVGQPREASETPAERVQGRS